MLACAAMKYSEQLYQRAIKHIPGGVNSPVRAFNGVGGTPVFFKRGEGAYVIDVDDKRYIDYVGSWGPMIAGHSHPEIVERVMEAVKAGMSFGAPTEIEVQIADKIIELMPNLDMVRMVNSGTEATMTAIRLARGVTKRDKIIKFQGCYHGHSDSLLVNAGSGALTLGVPSSPGVPESLVQHTLTATFNDLDSVEQLFQQYPNEIAGIILEPVSGNMNCVLPQEGFLPGLRALCDQYQALLIIDEVMTGFRVALGGAQSVYNIKPDITTLGKVIGGGMPVGALGGREEIMSQLAPSGPIYQAGTLSGNPVAMTAGLTALTLISQPGFFERLSAQTEKLVQGLCARAETAGIPFTTNHLGGMFGFFFSDSSPVTSYQQVTNCNIERFQRFYHGMLQQGIYLAPSAYEAGFISSEHGDEEIEMTLNAAEIVFTHCK